MVILFFSISSPLKYENLLISTNHMNQSNNIYRTFDKNNPANLEFWMDFYYLSKQAKIISQV